MPQQSSDLTGQTLGQGQYEIRDVIGKGGMSTVYRAVQRSVGREVAIKVLSPELAADERLLARFEREARIVAQLQHPNILTVHDFGREDGVLYLVLRLMTGGNLMDVLRKQGRLPARQTIKLVYQIAAALDYAHGRGIIHRDLKPSNVLLDDDGNVSLTDFGIAKMVQGSTATGLTAANAMMGTPVYMAPEQWRSEAVSPRTDVYALGVMTYWMVVGQVPFSAETPHGLMYQHINETPAAPRSLNPDVPRAVEPVLGRALAKQPQTRFASAGAFASALDEAFNAPRRSSDTRADRTLRNTPPGTPPEAQAPGRTQRTAPPPSAYDGRSVPRDTQRQPRHTQQSVFGSHHGTPPPEGHLKDRLKSAHPQLTSTGYTAPYRPPYAERSQYDARSSRERYQDGYLSDTNPGIGRFFWVVGGVSLIVVIAFVLLLVTSLLAGSSGSDDPSDDSRSGDDAPAAATTVPDELRPSATIQQPANQALVSLGSTVRVEYVATNSEGITEVQLRRFGQVIDSTPTGDAKRYQGVFIYTPDSTGPHTLEVIPWNGKIAGTPARVIIFVQ